MRVKILFESRSWEVGKVTIGSWEVESLPSKITVAKENFKNPIIWIIIVPNENLAPKYFRYFILRKSFILYIRFISNMLCYKR